MKKFLGPMALISAGAIALAGLVAPIRASAAPTPLRNGSTDSLAAASCWAIKQENPSSASGVYWLQTPALVAPKQFYCDMTTDGGGWVLIGRGRDGWTWSQNGQGAAADVANTPEGPDAFAPATLTNSEVDGLLNGTRVDALADGIRVRRAQNTSGTTWQELRLKATARTNWSWAIGGGIRLNSIVNLSTNLTYNGNLSTQSWSQDNNYLRISTAENSTHNWRMGWGFGSNVSGSSSPSSYLWTYSNERSALPFTQVFLRPKLLNSQVTYPAIPTSGTTASTQRAGLVSSRTSPATPWGVTGIFGPVSELNMEVQAFARVGNTMFVGGGFRYVQKGANPGPDEKVEQSRLAAFDVVTGEWINSFRPVVNGMVWDLQALPDGRLAVGGEFSNINGEAGTSGLAVLDPATGQVSPTFRTNITYPNTSNLGLQVKALDYQDGWLYIGGRFNRIAGGVPLGSDIVVGRAARVSATTGEPDGTWKPNFDGTIVDLDASAQGDRVFMSGYFDNVNWEPSARRAVVSTAPGAANIPGQGPHVPSIGSNKTYQQAILEVGNRVWLGGSEHSTQMYDRGDFTLMKAAMTKQGGDTQVIGELNGVVYVSCHCGNYVYSDSNNFSSPVGGASGVTNVKYIMAFDAVTGELIPDFYPSALDTRSGMGGWALEGDQYGCLWFGGDFKRGSYQPSGYQWLGGFGKFCQQDASAPSAPTGLTGTTSAQGHELSWGAATDDSGALRYEVLRDDRVIATVNGRSYIDVGAPVPSNYWVRAIDYSGNRSVSTPLTAVLAPDVTAPTVPANARVEGATSSTLPLVWEASTDDRLVTGYRVTRDGQAVVTVDALSWTDVGLAPNTSHTYTVAARDAAGNWSAESAPVQAMTLPDSQAPDAVTGVTGTPNVTGSTVTVTWLASVSPDTASYRIARDGVTLAENLTSLGYTDATVAPATSYTYTVVAVDGAGNVSSGADVAVVTPATPSNVQTMTWPDGAGSAWPASWTATSSSGSVTQNAGAGVLAFDDVAGAYARAVLSGQAPQADQEVLLSSSFSASNAVAYQTVYLRGSGGWFNAYRPASGYGVQLASNASAVTVQRTVGASTVTLATISGARQVSTGKQWLRLRVDGNQVSVKTWVDGTPEPTDWTWTGTDDVITGSGRLFVSHIRGGSNTGAKAISFASMELTTITH